MCSGRYVVEEFAVQRPTAEAFGADQTLCSFQRLSLDVGIQPAAEDLRHVVQTRVRLGGNGARFDDDRICCAADVVGQPLARC